MNKLNDFILHTSHPILVTGSAGFIGFHLSRILLRRGYAVVGYDNMNDYYDPAIKQARLDILQKEKEFSFVQDDLQNKEKLDEVFKKFKPDYVVNLAAQAGVRYSLLNPHAYISSNIEGFLNILESCRHHGVKHLAYASSSSVYGSNTRQPFSTHENIDHPISLYAASKKSNELMAHTYSHLYNIPTTGLRFFTVYGPWGRPDMALFLFTKAILDGNPIDIFNHGNMQRDFTYVDDITQAVQRILSIPAAPNPDYNNEQPDAATSHAPYRIYNIGNNNPVLLMDMIAALEDELGIEAMKNFLPLQAGDVPSTYADVQDLYDTISFKPETNIKNGIANFVKWYKDFYKI